jgi:hypothetical protein
MPNIKNIPVGSYVHLETWKLGDKLYSSWMDDNPGEYGLEISQLNPKEEILPAGKYKLVIDYPLSTEYVEELEFGKPVTREQIVEWIVASYHYIYKMEDESTPVPAGLIPGMFNRVTTMGTYGIWGHELGDLDLHTIHVDDNNLITIGVDS